MHLRSGDCEGELERSKKTQAGFKSRAARLRGDDAPRVAQTGDERLLSFSVSLMFSE
jgi:hypothetical protein